MPALDKTDIAIINALMKDGRKSFREIARETGVSTPTVKTRFQRMLDIGLIRAISPILNIEKVTSNINALVSIKALANKVLDIADQLALLEEVRNIYIISGNNNIMLRVVVKDPESLELLIRERIARMDGVKDVTSRVITKIIKEEQSIVLKEGSLVKIECDYCKKEIEREAKFLKVGEYERHFCCTSCLTLYKEKYKGRITAHSM